MSMIPEPSKEVLTKRVDFSEKTENWEDEEFLAVTEKSGKLTIEEK